MPEPFSFGGRPRLGYSATIDIARRGIRGTGASLVAEVRATVEKLRERTSILVAHKMNLVLEDEDDCER